MEKRVFAMSTDIANDFSVSHDEVMRKAKWLTSNFPTLNQCFKKDIHRREDRSTYEGFMVNKTGFELLITCLHTKEARDWYTAFCDWYRNKETMSNLEYRKAYANLYYLLYDEEDMEAFLEGDEDYAFVGD